MKTKIKAISELILGVLFLTAALSGYYKEIPHMWEYCFISALTIGSIFLISFIYYLVKKKHIAEWIYLACVTDISIILIATVVIQLNLDGAFWFIHIINPVLLLMFWFIFCDSRNIINPLLACTAIVFPLLYIVVSFIRFKITGLCAFPANLILKWSPQIITLLIILTLTVIVILLSFGLYYLNRLLYRMKEKYEYTKQPN